jgi:predicted TIM-barrel fold metal-dependent hydrolase
MAIPIFDSLTHPTIDSNWILPRYPNCASIDLLIQQMSEANVKGVFAVGMNGIGGYNDIEFAKMLKNSSTNSIFPIAFINPNSKNLEIIKEQLKRVKNLGYYGIKLHPRLSDFSLDDNISTIIKIANDLDLNCLLCTYPYSSNNARTITPELVMEMLEKTDGAKVLLMHSGAVRILEYMEIARVFNNVLLDLSLTICKYEGSSIDLDVAFIFNQFDRRICIGSDFPEYSMSKLRERFDYFSTGLSLEKKENIASRNICNFCSINLA